MRSYPVLDPVSRAYPRVGGRSPTCYSPVRRSCTPKGLTARLACVKHAASVRPEPGSNSPNKNPRTNRKEFTIRENLTKQPVQNWSNNTTPLNGKKRHDKNNNKQKPPNTLLSSQTTHPRCRQPCHCTPYGQRRQTPSSSPNGLGPWASQQRLRLWRA